MNDTMVSIRLDSELLEQIKKYKLSLSEEVRKALRNRVKKEKDQHLKKLMDEAAPVARKMDIKQVVKDIREMRESR